MSFQPNNSDPSISSVSQNVTGMSAEKVTAYGGIVINQSTGGQGGTDENRKIWFNVEPPIPNYMARGSVLTQIHQELQMTTAQKLTPDATAAPRRLPLKYLIIKGVEGVGKSQLAKKYISKFGAQYDHVLWFDAQTFLSISKQVKQLAETTFIMTTGHILQRDEFPLTTDLLKAIYARLFPSEHQKCLIVFDGWNSSSVYKILPFKKLKGNIDEKPFEHFLPSTAVPGSCQPPRLLFTCRDTNWLDTERPATQEKFKIIELDMFTHTETLKYIQVMSNTEIKNESSHGNHKAGTETEDKLTKNKTAANILGSRPADLEMALKNFRLEHSDSQNLDLWLSTLPISQQCLPQFDQVTCAHWRSTFIEIEKMSANAIKLFRILIFLHPDNIFVEHLQKIAAIHYHDDEVGTGLDLLQNYGIITVSPPADGGHIFTNREAQFAFLKQFKEDTDTSGFVENLESLIRSFNTCIDAMATQRTTMDDQPLWSNLVRHFLYFVNNHVTPTFVVLDNCPKMAGQQKQFFVTVTLFLETIRSALFKFIGKGTLFADVLESRTIFQKLYDQINHHMLFIHKATTTSFLLTLAQLSEMTGNFADCQKMYGKAYCQLHQVFGEANPKTVLVRQSILKVSGLIATQHFLEGRHDLALNWHVHSRTGTIEIDHWGGDRTAKFMIPRMPEEGEDRKIVQGKKIQIMISEEGNNFNKIRSPISRQLIDTDADEASSFQFAQKNFKDALDLYRNLLHESTGRGSDVSPGQVKAIQDNIRKLTYLLQQEEEDGTKMAIEQLSSSPQFGWTDNLNTSDSVIVADDDPQLEDNDDGQSEMGKVELVKPAVSAAKVLVQEKMEQRKERDANSGSIETLLDCMDCCIRAIRAKVASMETEKRQQKMESTTASLERKVNELTKAVAEQQKTTMELRRTLHEFMERTGNPGGST